jgi:hypothetical protein
MTDAHPPLPGVADAAVRLARDGDRQRAVRQLQDLAGDRACLEALRDYFVVRLHRRHDDYDATHGLRLVITALQHTPTTNDEVPGPARLDRRVSSGVRLPWTRR